MQPREGVLNEDIIDVIKDLKKLKYTTKQIAFLTNINEEVVISITENIIKEENLPKKINIDIQGKTKEDIFNQFLFKESLSSRKSGEMRDLKRDDKNNK